MSSIPHASSLLIALGDIAGEGISVSSQIQAVLTTYSSEGPQTSKALSSFARSSSGKASQFLARLPVMHTSETSNYTHLDSLEEVV